MEIYVVLVEIKFDQLKSLSAQAIMQTTGARKT